MIERRKGFFVVSSKDIQNIKNIKSVHQRQNTMYKRRSDKIPEPKKQKDRAFVGLVFPLSWDC